MREHDAIEGRHEARLIEPRLRKRERGGGLLGAGAGLQYRLGPGPGLDEPGALPGFRHAGLGDPELRAGRLEVARRDRVPLQEILLPVEIELGALAFGLRAAEHGFGRGDLLRTRSGFELGEQGLGGGQLRAAQRDLLHLLGILEPRYGLPHLDALSRVDEALRETA
ncbi:MAG: hypothetical protein ACKOTE_08585, partial [Opitutaceae bacterium]